MDGHFVPNLTIGPPVIKTLRKHSELTFDVHLMISPVHKYIKDFADAGADIITIHPEATDNLAESIKHIKSFKKKVGISLNPNTEINIIENELKNVDLILVMSVYPGFGGQKFIPDVIKKIELSKNTSKIIGSSESMQDIYKSIGKIASTNVDVLILGETGTGKELIAKSIHENSERKNSPFIAINTGAIPTELLESELFGHEKGSFTGAYNLSLIHI